MKQRGTAMTFCLVVMALLVMLSVGAGGLAGTSLSLARSDRRNAIAFQVAQGALELGVTDEVAALQVSKGVFNSATFTYTDTMSAAVPGCTATVSVSADATKTYAWVTSTATYDGKTKSIRTLIKAKDVGIWNNAIFAGTGASGQSINGNVDIRGSVHILGDGEAYTDLNHNGNWDAAESFTDSNHNGVWDPGEPFVDANGDGVWNPAEPYNDTNGNGVYDPPLTTTQLADSMSGSANIGNNYTGMSSSLESLISAAPKINGLEDLQTEVRVKHGEIGISGSAQIGYNGAQDNGTSKGTVAGMYVNDGYTGNQGASHVFSDNGTTNTYDLGTLGITMPLISGIGADTYTDSNNTTWTNEYAYLQSRSLTVNVGTVTSTTTAFSYGPDAYGNSISFTPKNGSTPCELTVNGVVRINGNIQIGSKDSIYYAGRGTIFAEGNINVDGDLLPSAGLSFPKTTAIGLLAKGNMNLATGNGSSQLSLAGAFYAQGTIKSAKQNQIAGTFVANYFDMGTNVPSIYQVPDLPKYMPPAMPGDKSYISMKLKSWRERQ